MCFYLNLKNKRQEKGLSQRSLAKTIGVAPSTYSQYENGKREPDVLKIKAIAQALNTTADYLIFGTDTPFSEDIPNIIDKYNLLNPLGKQKADEYIEDLKANPKYTQEPEKEKAELKRA